MVVISVNRVMSVFKWKNFNPLAYKIIINCPEEKRQKHFILKIADSSNMIMKFNVIYVSLISFLPKIIWIVFRNLISPIVWLLIMIWRNVIHARMVLLIFWVFVKVLKSNTVKFIRIIWHIKNVLLVKTDLSWNKKLVWMGTLKIV